MRRGGASAQQCIRGPIPLLNLPPDVPIRQLDGILTLSPLQSRLVVGAAVTSGVLWLAFVAHAAFDLGGAGLDSFFNSFLYNALLLIAAASCLTRAAVLREERAPWAIMGLGILAWTAGEIYYSAALSQRDEVPIPSLADAGYLIFYPMSYVALAMLVRARMPGFRRSLWLDGAIAALAVSALAAALAFERIMELSIYGDAWSVATNLAYPVGDLVLLGMVVAVFGLSGWRPGTAWKLIGAGLAAMAVADGDLSAAGRRGHLRRGRAARHPLARLCTARRLRRLGPVAGARLTHRARGHPRGARARRCGILAIALAAAADLTMLGEAPMALSLATLFLVTIRMAWAFRDNQKMLVDSRVEALTDALTGLGNRRSMMGDLEERHAGRHARRPHPGRPVRPRRVQELQRLLRAPGRRRAPRPSRSQARRSQRALRRRLPPWRRRVLRARPARRRPDANL